MAATKKGSVGGVVGFALNVCQIHLSFLINRREKVEVIKKPLNIV